MTGSGAARLRLPRLSAPSLPVALLLLALSLAGFGAVAAVHGMPMDDVQVYRAEGAAVWHGTDLYGFTVTAWDLPATYPPFAALLFVPTALVPQGVAEAAFVVGNVALLAWLTALSLRAVRTTAHPAATPSRAVPRPRAAPVLPGAVARPGGAPLPVVLSLTAVALWLEPVFQTVAFGQINLALACLVLWDLGRPEGAHGKGFAVGVAAGVKLTPALFAVHLLLTGRIRQVGWAAAGFAASAGVGACVLPGASVEFWTRRMFETARVGKAWIVDNQSLQGLVARLLHDAAPAAPLWLVPAALTAAGGLWLARWTTTGGRRGTSVPPGGRRARLVSGDGQGAGLGEFWGIVVTALVGLLVSPISWSHHWVWCVPLLAGLAATAARCPAGSAARTRWTVLGCAVAVVFTARTLWLVPRKGDLDLRLEWWQQPLAAPYTLLALALLAAAAGYAAAGRRPVPLTPHVPAARSGADGHARGHHRAAPPAAGARQDGRRPECDPD